MPTAGPFTGSSTAFGIINLCTKGHVENAMGCCTRIIAAPTKHSDLPVGFQLGIYSTECVHEHTSLMQDVSSRQARHHLVVAKRSLPLGKTRHSLSPASQMVRACLANQAVPTLPLGPPAAVPQAPCLGRSSSSNRQSHNRVRLAAQVRHKVSTYEELLWDFVLLSLFLDRGNSLL